MADENVLSFDRDKQLIERIELLMNNPPEGSIVLEFTPGVARHILKNFHGKNRREKPSSIKRYQLDMADDEWKLNGSTIVFTDLHMLGDGQNRMMACSRAEKPFKSHVIFNVSHEHFATIDQGRVRDPNDVLHIYGVANSLVVSQAVRWAELIETNKVPRRTSFRPKEVLDLYKTKHKRVEDFLPEARRIYSRTRQPVGMVAALLYTFDKVDSDFAADFADAWALGTYGAPFISIGRMQAELTKLSNIGSGRVHDVVRAAMIINAWNSAHEGKAGNGRVKWDPGLPFPMIR